MRPAQTAGVFVAVLVLAQPAMALPPGVFVSPGSPAGKEYSFPLSVLRGQAVGHSAAGYANEPLFGVGIKPARPAGTATARRTRDSAAARRHRHARGASRGATGSGTGGNPGQR